MLNMSHSEQFWSFFLCFGLGSLIIVSNLALRERLKFPDTSRDSGRFFLVLLSLLLLLLLLLLSLCQ